LLLTVLRKLVLQGQRTIIHFDILFLLVLFLLFCLFLQSLQVNLLQRLNEFGLSFDLLALEILQQLTRARGRLSLRLQDFAQGFPNHLRKGLVVVLKHKHFAQLLNRVFQNLARLCF